MNAKHVPESTGTDGTATNATATGNCPRTGATPDTAPRAMRAAQITAFRRPIEVGEVPVAAPRADGAVVMSKHHKLLGFGGMISARLPAVRSVARALDLEGEAVAEEETGNVGARHQSAYRLAGALPGAVVIVISQDGGVRFVCQKAGRVTCWEQE